MKLKSKNWSPALAAAGCLLAASALHAGPVTVGISAVTITPGAGYGVDSGPNPENGATLLDVQFTSVFSAQSFQLVNVGDSRDFPVGTVLFNEPDIGSGSNLGIRNNELDDLGVTVDFTVTDPLGTTATLTATGTATVGLIGDAEVDYELAWAPLEVDFGAGGRLRFTLNSMTFSAVGTQTARATVELLAAPGGDPRLANVPEPTSAALAGIALIAAGWARRRRQA
jgi:hypothetical protein